MKRVANTFEPGLAAGVARVEKYSPPGYRFLITRPVVLNLSWLVDPFQRLSTLVASCSSIKITNCVFNVFPSVIAFATFNNKKKSQQGRSMRS